MQRLPTSESQSSIDETQDISVEKKMHDMNHYRATFVGVLLIVFATRGKGLLPSPRSGPV